MDTAVGMSKPASKLAAKGRLWVQPQNDEPPAYLRLLAADANDNMVSPPIDIPKVRNGLRTAGLKPPLPSFSPSSVTSAGTLVDDYDRTRERSESPTTIDESLSEEVDAVPVVGVSGLEVSAVAQPVVVCTCEIVMTEEEKREANSITFLFWYQLKDQEKLKLRKGGSVASFDPTRSRVSDTHQSPPNN
jgi:hypothetical protein